MEPTKKGTHNFNIFFSNLSFFIISFKNVESSWKFLFFIFLGTSNLTGVRYISEDLIKKITKLEHLEAVTTLNLTLSREVGKKIKVCIIYDFYYCLAHMSMDQVPFKLGLGKARPCSAPHRLPFIRRRHIYR